MLKNYKRIPVFCSNRECKRKSSFTYRLTEYKTGFVEMQNAVFIYLSKFFLLLDSFKDE